MIGYALRLYGRDRFKPSAIRLMLGPHLTPARASGLAAHFAAWRVPRDVPPGAQASIARDRAEGYQLLMATAAPEFYAGAIADALGFDAIVASRHQRDADGNWLPMLDGPNCYGAEKARRVAEWLSTHAPGTRISAPIRIISATRRPLPLPMKPGSSDAATNLSGWRHSTAGRRPILKKRRQAPPPRFDNAHPLPVHR